MSKVITMEDGKFFVRHEEYSVGAPPMKINARAVTIGDTTFTWQVVRALYELFHTNYPDAPEFKQIQ